jgi:hypothetical protein
MLGRGIKLMRAIAVSSVAIAFAGFACRAAIAQQIAHCYSVGDREPYQTLCENLDNADIISVDLLPNPARGAVPGNSSSGTGSSAPVVPAASGVVSSSAVTPGNVGQLRDLLNDMPGRSPDMSVAPGGTGATGSTLNWNTFIATARTIESKQSYGTAIPTHQTGTDATADCKDLGHIDPEQANAAGTFFINNKLTASTINRSPFEDLLQSEFGVHFDIQNQDNDGLLKFFYSIQQIAASEGPLDATRRQIVSRASSELSAFSGNCIKALEPALTKLTQEPIDGWLSSNLAGADIEGHVDTVFASQGGDNVWALRSMGLSAPASEARSSIRSSLPQSVVVSNTYWRLRLTEYRLASANPLSPQARNARDIGLESVLLGYRALAASDDQSSRAYAVIARAMLDIVLSLDPLTAVSRDIYELITGTGLVSGERLSPTARGLALASIVTLGVLSDVNVLRKSLLSILALREGQLVARSAAALSVESEGLLRALAQSGVRHTPEDIVAITRARGEIVFLERGSESAGLKHILSQHLEDFERAGIRQEDIPDAIMKAVSEGKVVGMEGSLRPRPVFEFQFDGKLRRIAVTIGDNGYVVGANPISLSAVFKEPVP